MRPIQNIQVLRAAAALMVVIFHAQNELGHRGLDNPFPNLTAGAFGVDLFFVISGFIMVYASVSLFGTAGASARFLSRRIVRIVPLYWLFTAGFALIAVVLAHYPGHADYSVKHIVASFLFIPAARPEDGGILPTYSLGWTLNYEMFFYLCFSLTIAWRKDVAVAAAAGALTMLVIAGRITDLPWPLAYWADTVTLEFVFGMLVAQAYLMGLRVPKVAGWMLVPAAALSILLYVPYIDSHSAWRGIAWGLPAAAVLSVAVSSGPNKGPLRRMLAALGDASYSLYLVHSAFFILVAACLARFDGLHRVPSPAYAALLVIGSILAAYALFWCFERPVTRFLQRRLQGRLSATRAEEASDRVGLPADLPCRTAS